MPAIQEPVGDPVHRFFQMWQQVDGDRRDLFVWVAESSGFGSKNRKDPASGTNQGGLAMGFYNMAAGDAPFFRQLADNYALSDNHHQPVMGGTGVNFQALATGHAIGYSSGNAPGEPPHNQIENPNPRPGTNNWYTQFGVYTKCADGGEPGVGAIRAYLASLPYHAYNDGNCEPGTYYMVNNQEAGFAATGEPLGRNSGRLPPQAKPTIAEALSAKGISWKWYSGGRDGDRVTAEYCGICDPLIYSSAVMTTPLRSSLQDHRPCSATSVMLRRCRLWRLSFRPTRNRATRRRPTSPVTRNSFAEWWRRYRPIGHCGKRRRSS